MDARTCYPDEDDFIVLGDLNADCNYFDEEDLNCPLRSMDYTWLIGNHEDTNLAASDCTYDRIIVTAGVREDYAKEAGVFRFDEVCGLAADFAKKVSDHYPVYARFAMGRDRGEAGS
jgi:hypothetical protein